MTWGQLRLQLQTGAPGVSLDLIDEYLNTRYEKILGFTDWKGLKQHATIQTTAAYQSSTDSVTLTVGQIMVTGSGTAWTAALVGMSFYRPGDTTTYTVESVPNSTTLSLDRGYEGNGTDGAGTVYTAATYVFMQNIYTLPNNCRSVVTCLDPVTGFPLLPFTKDRADESWGPRTLVEDPTSYAAYDDSDESTPPVLKQIEFFPPPLYSRGIPLEYRISANMFDGGNTASAPLPWVWNSVLLDGCRADIQTYLEKYAGAAAYEAKFLAGLERMVLQEKAEQPKVAMHMAQRFVRHRMQRAGRGLNNYWGPGQGGPN